MKSIHLKFDACCWNIQHHKMQLMAALCGLTLDDVPTGSGSGSATCSHVGPVPKPLTPDSWPGLAAICYNLGVLSLGCCTSSWTLTPPAAMQVLSLIADIPW